MGRMCEALSELPCSAVGPQLLELLVVGIVYNLKACPWECYFPVSYCHQVVMRAGGVRYANQSY